MKDLATMTAASGANESSYSALARRVFELSAKEISALRGKERNYFLSLIKTGDTDLKSSLKEILMQQELPAYAAENLTPVLLADTEPDFITMRVLSLLQEAFSDELVTP